jgi:hypothetical protein
MIPTYVKITKNKNRHTKNDGNSMCENWKGLVETEGFFPQEWTPFSLSAGSPKPQKF